MRAVGYLRVSTDRQAEEGLGLEVQEQAIRDWTGTEGQGHSLIAVTKDEGISGSNGIDTRLGLAEALEMLRDGRADVLVVYRLDRLARDLVLQEQLLAEVWRLGCQVVSCSKAEAGYLSNDPDDPSRALIRQVLGAVSQYERSMIAMRLRNGRARKRLNGGFGGGTPPFGWRNIEGVGLIEDEREQSVIRRINELRTDGYSLTSIARQLETEGARSRQSDRWHPESVRRVIAKAN